jgi:hypothetical protein
LPATSLASNSRMSDAQSLCPGLPASLMAEQRLTVQLLNTSLSHPDRPSCAVTSRLSKLKNC